MLEEDFDDYGDDFFDMDALTYSGTVMAWLAALGILTVATTMVAAVKVKGLLTRR